MPASSSSATAAQVLMHAMVSSSSSRRRLRLVLGTFCILNAFTAFLFAWMMSTEQTSFALTAARRRWNLRERSNATCKAGVYYVIIGLMLLVDCLSCTIAVIVQLGVRFVRAGCSLILRWLLWCARVIPASRGRGLLLRRFVTRSAGALPENYRVLLQSNSSARPPRSPPSAAVPATGAARAPSSHRLLPRVAGIHLGSSLQGAQASSTLETLADLERDRRPRTATASPPSIRLRSS
ncbi:hypothetical protein, conserved [Leishmania lindenbergi]|uniref:Uncharacterized protein n=1 Tax=Leishmania lindenbergi TaxID=651832 RepID=A0AAW3AJT9_9TRYP